MHLKAPKPNELAWLRIAGQASFIPVYLALFPIAFYFIGGWLDTQFETEWIKPVFLFLGLIHGFRECFLLIRKLLREQEMRGRGSK